MACSNNRPVVGVIDFISWWENDVNQPCLAAWAPPWSGRVQQGHGWLEGGCGWFHSPALSLGSQGLGEICQGLWGWNELSQQWWVSCQGWGIPLERDGAGAGEGRGGGRMDGKSSSCSFSFIDLGINNGMNLKWISGVSAKAGYFCHKWRVRGSESTAVQGMGRRRTWCSQESVLCSKRAASILSWGSGEIQCFSKLEKSQWNTLKIHKWPHVPTSNCSPSQGCASASPSPGPRSWQSPAAFLTSFHRPYFSFLLSFSLTPGSYFQILQDYNALIFYLKKKKNQASFPLEKQLNISF